jgi:hypothetical protein
MSATVVVEGLQTRLAAAEAAYHRLMTGQAARVVVDQNGERVEFTAVSATQLANYIARLKAEIGSLLGVPAKVNRPIGFLF